jgi:hypothetical protein
MSQAPLFDDVDELVAEVQADRELAIAAGVTPEHFNPLTADELFCKKCGSTITVDVPIHGGRSTRRDCGRCGRTLGFPRWNEATQ